MVTKEIIVQGAICECQFGFMPDKMKVLTQKMHYANDKDGANKLIATDKDIGMTFEKNTFGQCKLQPTAGGYLPCVPALTQWQGMYNDMELTNKGKILLEDSKGICSIAGSPCIKFIHSGQMAQPAPQHMNNVDKVVLSQVNPFVSCPEEDKSSEVDFSTL